MKYPDYVKNFRPKGTIVKRVNDEYYAYYATSMRVPGKSYPVQVIKGLAGKIDVKGFHALTKAVVNTEKVVIRECGFTNFLLKFEDEYVCHRSDKVKDSKDIYHSMIVYLSNNSYLCDEKNTKIYTVTELVNKFNIGIPNQITAITKIVGYEMREIEALKYICCVQMGNRRFESTLTLRQKELLEELGVDEEYVRKR